MTELPSDDDEIRALLEAVQESLIALAAIERRFLEAHAASPHRKILGLALRELVGAAHTRLLARVRATMPQGAGLAAFAADYARRHMVLIDVDLTKAAS